MQNIYLEQFLLRIYKSEVAAKVKTIDVYASAPLQKVIGELDFIINDNLEALWEKAKQFAVIDEDYFYKYFSDKEQAFAIKIKNTRHYKKVKSLQDYYKVTATQSFLYL